MTRKAKAIGQTGCVSRHKAITTGPSPATSSGRFSVSCTIAGTEYKNSLATTTWRFTIRQGGPLGPEHAERIRECLDILYWGHGFVSDLARFGREASRAPIRCATPLTVSECCQHTVGLRSYWTAIELAAEVRNLEVPATLCTVLLLLRISTGTLSRMVRLEGGLVDRHVTLRAVALDRPKDGTRNRYTMRTVIDHVETSDGMCILTLGPEASWSCSLPKRNACEIHPLDRR